MGTDSGRAGQEQAERGDGGGWADTEGAGRGAEERTEGGWAQPRKLIVATTRPWAGSGVTACRAAVTATSTDWLSTPYRMLIVIRAAAAAGPERRRTDVHSMTRVGAERGEDDQSAVTETSRQPGGQERPNQHSRAERSEH